MKSTVQKNHLGTQMLYSVDPYIKNGVKLLSQTPNKFKNDKKLGKLLTLLFT